VISSLLGQISYPPLMSIQSSCAGIISRMVTEALASWKPVYPMWSLRLEKAETWVIPMLLVVAGVLAVTR